MHCHTIGRVILPVTKIESALSMVRASVADFGETGARHQFWLFTGEGQRRSIERELATDGVQLQALSAFKPLVSCVLEQRARIGAVAGPAGGPLHFEVEYPVHPGAVENRFRLEAYPLHRLVQHWWPGSEVRWVGKAIEREGDVRYRVSVSRHQAGGRQVSEHHAGASDLQPRAVRGREDKGIAAAPEGAGASGGLQLEVFAPNRLIELPDRQALTPCGWWLATAADGTVLRNQPWQSDYEAAYKIVMDAVVAQGYKGRGPHFNQLRVEVQHDGIEQRLPVSHDRLDTAEALHEELYFSLLEHFARVADLKGGSRQLQPGQIVPVVRNVVGGSTTVSVTATPPVVGAPGDLAGQSSAATASMHPEARPGGAACAQAEPVGKGVGRDIGVVLTAADLGAVGAALAAADVEATVLAMPGERYQAATPQGRQVHGLLRRGTLPPVVINGGQHANENSGVIGALRAAYELLRNPDATVGLVALENPDGYALHHELCRAHPEHMHHAARYSALGDDLEYRSDDAPLESAVRRRLLADSAEHSLGTQALDSGLNSGSVSQPDSAQRSTTEHPSVASAQLFINLHGYPAHEWVRPLTGYLPHKFEGWAVPQGFLLIARYQPGYAEQAEKLLRHVATQLQEQLPQLVAYNQQQLETYEAHAGKLLFPLEGAVPLLLSEAKQPGPAIQIITEFPDETVYGDDLRLAHETQYRAAVLAARYWWQLAGS